MECEQLRQAYRKAVAEIVARAPRGVNPEFRPANTKELNILRSLELPASIELFYEEFAPDEKLGVWGILRDCVLLPIAGIEWYTSQGQGPSLRLCDYIVFATTCSGDFYCFDVTRGNDGDTVPVFLISHEINYAQSSREKIATHRELVAESLLDFLKEF
jgi:hypothetical protein